MLELPKGFSTYALGANVKYKNRDDLGIIYSDTPCEYAGVFTSNKVFAAPVKLCRERLFKPISAVVINSGNANACTGQRGYEDALSICKKAEAVFNLKESSALSLSTGVIGVPLPVQNILSGIENYKDGKTEAEAFSKSIITTDSYPKYIDKKIQINNKEVRITGFAKGAGMICPNMATMLGFLLTDAGIKSDVMKEMLLENVNESFNCITVDGDMSTNDSVIFLANGKSAAIESDEEKKLFKNALKEVMLELAKMIVRDGEGATKLIEFQIEKAQSLEDAKLIGQAIANSLLVKTAFFGNDPNWGRIICAAGYSGADVSEEQMQLYIGGYCLFDGKSLEIDRKALISDMKESRELTVRLVLNKGDFSKTFFSCDLSYDYVNINAEYTT